VHLARPLLHSPGLQLSQNVRSRCWLASNSPLVSNPYQCRGLVLPGAPALLGGLLCCCHHVSATSSEHCRLGHPAHAVGRKPRHKIRHRCRSTITESYAKRPDPVKCRQSACQRCLRPSASFRDHSQRWHHRTGERPACSACYHRDAASEERTETIASSVSGSQAKKQQQRYSCGGPAATTRTCWTFRQKYFWSCVDSGAPPSCSTPMAGMLHVHSHLQFMSLYCTSGSNRVFLVPGWYDWYALSIG
jgi:hypothetical protein